MRLIVVREIKNNIRALLVWSIAMAAVIFAMAMCFDSMGDELKASLESLPSSMLSAFGMNSIAIGSLEGAYSQGYIIVTLMGSMYIAYLGAGILVKEEDEGSIEYLMCKPFSRKEIYISKFLALLIMIFILNIFIAMATIIGAIIYGGESYNEEAIYLMAFAPCLLHLTFGCLCFGLSSFISKNRQAVGMSIGIVSVFYIFSILAGLSEKLEWLKKISIFDYVSTNVVAGEKCIAGYNLAIMGAIIIVSVIFGTVIYNKKDF